MESINTCPIDELKDNDILLGRGTGPNEHNKFFRSLIAKNKGAYSAAKTRKERAIVIKDTITAIKNKNGRFLKKYKMISGNQNFVVIDDLSVIRAKTKQAFRYCIEGGNKKKLNNDEAESKSPPPQSGFMPVSLGGANAPSYYSAARVTPPFEPMPMIPHARFHDSPPSRNDHSALALLAEQAAVEQDHYEYDRPAAFMEMQPFRMQESPGLGFLVPATRNRQSFGDYRLRPGAAPPAGQITFRINNPGAFVRPNLYFSYVHEPTNYVQPGF
jgi:hypothetical protein